MQSFTMSPGTSVAKMARAMGKAEPVAPKRRTRRPAPEPVAPVVAAPEPEPSVEPEN